MAKTDINGRPYAFIKNLKAGDKVETDDLFTCGIKNKTLEVQHDGIRHPYAGLYVTCNCGRHYLNGQSNYSGGPLMGIYHAGV